MSIDMSLSTNLIRSRAQDKGGHATTEKDVGSSAAKAKKDYPEAPDTVIGMQDERGGKGY